TVTPGSACSRVGGQKRQNCSRLDIQTAPRLVDHRPCLLTSVRQYRGISLDALTKLSMNCHRTPLEHLRFICRNILLGLKRSLVRYIFASAEYQNRKEPRSTIPTLLRDGTGSKLTDVVGVHTLRGN